MTANHEIPQQMTYEELAEAYYLRGKHIEELETQVTAAYAAANDLIQAKNDEIVGLKAQATPSLFEQVMTASERYVTRFGGELNPYGAEDKAEEEFEEFKVECDAIAFHLSFEEPHSVAHKLLIEQSRKDAAEELVDCLVTLGGMAACAGLTWQDIQEAAHSKLDKLNQRTVETHAWNGRTVERKDKAQS